MLYILYKVIYLLKHSTTLLKDVIGGVKAKLYLDVKKKKNTNTLIFNILQNIHNYYLL